MRHCLFFFLLFISKGVFSQGFIVKEMKEVISGSEAFHAPVDSFGHTCGLIKIQTTIPDLIFEGQIIGNVSYITNEYHLFMRRGSDKLQIKHHQYLPVLVDFKDYGIQVSSKATYQISLKDVKLHPEKNCILMNVKPNNSRFYVNNILIDNDNLGNYKLLLPKGEYVLRIELEGYRPKTQICKVGRETNSLNIELESVMATLEVNSSTSGADLIINGVKKAIGNWKGEVPAGNYVIEVQKKGFISVSRRISLGEKDKKTIQIPELERNKGSLFVKTTPVVCDIYIDGSYKGKSNDLICDLYAGEHTLEIVPKFGYLKIKEIINLEERLTLQRNLNPSNEIYKRAFNGDIDAQMSLAMKYREKGFDTDVRTNSLIVDIEQSDYWYDMAYENIQKISKENFLKFVDNLINHYYIYSPRTFNPSKALKLYLKKGEIEGKYNNICIATCYESLKRFDEAILYIKKEISRKDEPDFNFSLDGLYARIGSYYVKAEDFENALIWYNKAKEEKLKEYRKYMNPNEHAYKFYCITTYAWEIADVYVKKNDIQKAVELYRQLKGKFVGKPDRAVEKLKELGY